LRGRAEPAGDARAHHELKRRFQLLVATFGAQVAVVLLVDTMKFNQLGVVLADGAGD